jgi:hypothetical protein
VHQSCVRTELSAVNGHSLRFKCRATTAINNYSYVLSAMGLSQDAIGARVRSAIEGEPA